MNNLPGYYSSKNNDERIVKLIIAHGHEARLSTDFEDKVNKIDIVFKNKHNVWKCIDTKYTSRIPTRFFFEVDKHGANSSSKADYIWYISRNDFNKTYLIKRSSLTRLTSDNRRRYVKNKDVLVDFNVNELKLNSDYFIINLEK